MLRRMVQMFSTGDLSELTTTVGPEYIDHQGIEGTPVRGPTGFATVVAAARDPFTKLEVAVEEVTMDGDLVTARLRWEGTRPDGTSQHRYTSETLRVREGLAEEHWGHPAD